MMGQKPPILAKNFFGILTGKKQSLQGHFMRGFPCGSAGKESTHNAADLGSIPGLGRSPGEGKGYPLWYSGLENSIDCIIHRVTESDTTQRAFTVSVGGGAEHQPRSVSVPVPTTGCPQADAK